MTRLMVSVRTVAEARGALAAGAALIDAKEPRNGALGALPATAIRAIVAAIDGLALTSAVTGDHDEFDAVLASARAVAASGVSLVKIGLDGPLMEAAPIAALGAALARQSRCIAVLFADGHCRLDLVGQLARAGFAGAMIDTRAKGGKRLGDFLDRDALAGFVAACRRNGMLSGLAGSLHPRDIDELAPIGANYLGFRGGLCLGGDRRQPLDMALVAEAARSLADAARQPRPQRETAA
jgi:(5-formylfuran-3-yl)methyl phosphate synthase